MKLFREVLLGWLVIVRYKLADMDEFVVPKEVGDGWIDLGWQQVDEHGIYVITETGATASDLVAPEWGVDPIAMDQP